MKISRHRNVGIIPTKMYFELKEKPDGILDYLMKYYGFSHMHPWTMTLPLSSDNFVCVQDTYSIDFEKD